MAYRGEFMQCDGDTSGYPYLACTCTYDPVNCENTNSDSGGTGSTSNNGTANSTETSSGAESFYLTSKSWALGVLFLGLFLLGLA